MLCVNNDGKGNNDMNRKNIFRLHAFVTFIEKYTKDLCTFTAYKLYLNKITEEKEHTYR